jgi:hypothetical protein
MKIVDTSDVVYGKVVKSEKLNKRKTALLIV